MPLDYAFASMPLKYGVGAMKIWFSKINFPLPLDRMKILSSELMIIRDKILASNPSYFHPLEVKKRQILQATRKQEEKRALLKWRRDNEKNAAWMARMMKTRNFG